MSVNKNLLFIPTYNEKKNILPLINKIKKYVKFKYDILFVDDNSIDGSKEIFNKLKEKNILIINRKKKLGIGSAHKAAIKFAYKNNYHYLISMDCDGTHNPKYIKKMTNLIKNNNLIITNRFAFKNALTQWSFHRKFITTFRHALVSLIFKTDLDSSGAFRCYDCNKIKLKDILSAKNDSYAFFIESTLILYKKNYKIDQIPIILPKRFSGSSKMSFKDLIIGFFYILFLFIKIK